MARTVRPLSRPSSLNQAPGQGHTSANGRSGNVKSSGGINPSDLSSSAAAALRQVQQMRLKHAAAAAAAARGGGKGGASNQVPARASSHQAPQSGGAARGLKTPASAPSAVPVATETAEDKSSAAVSASAAAGREKARVWLAGMSGDVGSTISGMMSAGKKRVSGSGAAVSDGEGGGGAVRISALADTAASTMRLRVADRPQQRQQQQQQHAGRHSGGYTETGGVPRSFTAPAEEDEYVAGSGGRGGGGGASARAAVSAVFGRRAAGSSSAGDLLTAQPSMRGAAAGGNNGSFIGSSGVVRRSAVFPEEARPGKVNGMQAGGTTPAGAGAGGLKGAAGHYNSGPVDVTAMLAGGTVGGIKAVSSTVRKGGMEGGGGAEAGDEAGERDAPAWRRWLRLRPRAEKI